MFVIILLPSTPHAVPLTMASLVISTVDYLSTMWRVKRLDHRQKSLPEPEERKVAGAVSFAGWMFISEVTQVRDTYIQRDHLLTQASMEDSLSCVLKITIMLLGWYLCSELAILPMQRLTS